MERENRAEARTELELETEAEMEDQGGVSICHEKVRGCSAPAAYFLCSRASETTSGRGVAV